MISLFNEPNEKVFAIDFNFSVVRVFSNDFTSFSYEEIFLILFS